MSDGGLGQAKRVLKGVMVVGGVGLGSNQMCVCMYVVWLVYVVCVVLCGVCVVYGVCVVCVWSVCGVCVVCVCARAEEGGRRCVYVCDHPRGHA